MTNNSISFKKQLTLIAITVISALILLVMLTQTVYAATPIMNIGGSYKQLEARAIEYYMNRDRKSGDGYYIDSNGVKHAAAKDHDIAMDARLEQVARIRAGELAMRYDHTRPNGKSFDSLYAGTMRSYQEYIFKMPEAASGHDSSIDAYNYWFNVGKGPAGYSMMSSQFKSSGCACFVYEGTEYWVLEFSILESDGALLPEILPGIRSVGIEYDESFLVPTYKIENVSNVESYVGNTVYCTNANTGVYKYYGAVKMGSLARSEYTFNVTSSDKNIAVVNSDTTVNAKAAGSCTITLGATLKNGTKVTPVSFKVSISAVSIYRASVCVNNVEVESLPHKIYTGNPIKQTFTLKFNGATLVEGTDYTVSYSDNVDVGRAGILITAKGKNFEGTKSLSFVIDRADISKATITVPTSVTYGGNNCQVKPTVKWTNGAVLKEGEDYILRYENTDKPGTATVKIIGWDKFEGEVKKTYTITKGNVSTLSPSAIADQTYTGSPITPNVYPGIVDTNYEIVYSNNVNAGTASATIKGKNYYEGTKTINFTIKPCEIKNAGVSLNSFYWDYSGNEIKPSIQYVRYAGKDLILGTDYTVSYADNVNAGTGYVVLTGKGNFTGTLKVGFIIRQQFFYDNRITVSGYKDHIAIGSPITYPDLTVSADGKPMKVSVDYKITYSDNVEPGRAKITLEGINNYKFTKYVYFNITEPTAQSKGVAAFVERLYTVALNRSYDPVGKMAWFDALMAGADGATVANGFFFSAELVNQKISNEEYVKRLYLTFMDREPDGAGYKAWVDALNKGASREKVFAGFVNSTEWANICLKYGIKSGGTGKPSIKIDPNDKITAFANRLYTTCLGRPADPAGLDAWARALANREGTGAKVAYGFFFSKELNDQKLSNKEFVTRLYKTFMDRSPDTAGLNSWVKALEDGASRETVFYGFAKSPEFVALCQDAGIDPY
ncbi:MAG: DUF4214 domain-containing protein [Saccharofermentans sp.]|nr:DUF4214 domain-containing protein [Saccharofermentans sp.]